MKQSSMRYALFCALLASFSLLGNTIELTTTIFPTASESSSSTCFAYLSESFRKAIVDLGTKYHNHPWSPNFKNLYAMSKESQNVAEYESLKQALDEALVVLNHVQNDFSTFDIAAPLENYKKLLNSSEVIEVTLVENDETNSTTATKGKCKTSCGKFCKLFVCDLNTGNLTVNCNANIRNLFVTRLTVDGVPFTAGANGEYAFIYNLVEQNVVQNDPWLWQTNGVLSAGITHTVGSPNITFSKAGHYLVTVKIATTLTGAGSIAYRLNGNVIAGTQNDVTHFNGSYFDLYAQAIITVAAGDIFSVVQLNSFYNQGTPAYPNGIMASIAISEVD